MQLDSSFASRMQDVNPAGTFRSSVPLYRARHHLLCIGDWGHIRLDKAWLPCRCGAQQPDLAAPFLWQQQVYGIHLRVTRRLADEIAVRFADDAEPAIKLNHLRLVRAQASINDVLL